MFSTVCELTDRCFWLLYPMMGLSDLGTPHIYSSGWLCPLSVVLQGLAARFIHFDSGASELQFCARAWTFFAVFTLMKSLFLSITCAHHI